MSRVSLLYPLVINKSQASATQALLRASILRPGAFFLKKWSAWSPPLGQIEERKNRLSIHFFEGYHTMVHNLRVPSKVLGNRVTIHFQYPILTHQHLPAQEMLTARQHGEPPSPYTEPWQQPLKAYSTAGVICGISPADQAYHLSFFQRNIRNRCKMLATCKNAEAKWSLVDGEVWAL